MPITKYECSWNEFTAFIESRHESKDTWLYRGQENDCWDLKSTLERACDRFGWTGRDRVVLEQRMLREFKRRLHHYTPNVPSEEQDDEWLAMMQHHGAPTRLLDFTYSPYVAAYFALERARNGGRIAIWAVNTDGLSRTFNSRFFSLARYYRDYQTNRDGASFSKLFSQPQPSRFVLSLAPFRLNDRQAFQRAAFLCPGDVTVSFRDNLKELVYQQGRMADVMCFSIATGTVGRDRDQILRKLDQMNINRVTLFPGLDGFAQSFEARIPSLFSDMKFPSHY